MFVVCSVSIIAFILTILDSRKIISCGMKAAFILIGFIAAIHYDYGNDYMPYYESYLRISNYSLKEILHEEVIRNNEYGWGIINLLFSGFGKYGFFVLVAVLSIFENWVFYRAIKKYVSREWWWLSIYIYLFATSMFLMSLTMMRQYFVTAVFVLLFDIIKQRKFIIPIITIIGLSTVHSSALFLLPFAFWGFLPAKGGKFYAVLFTGIYIFCVVSSSFAASLFNSLLSFEEISNYAEIYGDGSNKNNGYGIGFILGFLLPACLYIYYLLKNSSFNRDRFLIVSLGSLKYVLNPFSKALPMMSRFFMYFGVFEVLAAPAVYSSVKDKLLRNSLLFIFMIMRLYDYIIFFSDPVWEKHYLEFKTIFSVI